MKGFLLGLLLMGYVGFLVVAVGFSSLHTNGYNQGAHTTQLYYTTTGEFPTQDWLDRYEGKKFLYPQEILETLKPFN